MIQFAVSVMNETLSVLRNSKQKPELAFATSPAHLQQQIVRLTGFLKENLAYFAILL